MSKFVKSLMMKDIAGRLKDVEGLAVFNPRGINATKNNQLRKKLHAQGLKVAVVKNALAKKAVGDGKLKGFERLLDGPSALVYGNQSVAAIARLLLEEKKADEKLELRGVFFDGEVYEGQKGVETASKLPTREEAIGTVVAAILGPGKKLAGAIKGPGGTLGALLKAIEEKGKGAEGGEAAAAPAGA